MLPAFLRSFSKYLWPRRPDTTRRPVRRQHHWLRLETLEDRLAPSATQLFGGLEFMTNGSFNVAGNAVTSTAPVQVGVAPAKNGAFTPVLQLDNGVSFMSNDSTGTFTTDGTVSGLAGTPTQTLQLLDAHLHTFTAPGLLNGSSYDTLPASDTNAAHLTVGGGQLTVTALHIAATELDLQGTIAMGSTVGLTVTVGGNDHVALNASGVSIAGPDPTVGAETFMFGGVTVMVQSLTVVNDQAAGQFQLSGMVTASFAGNTVTVNLGNGNTPGLVITNGQVTSFDGSITSNLKFGGVTFQTQDLEVAYTAGADLTVTGEMSFLFDNQTIGLALGASGPDGRQYPGLDVDPATGALKSLAAGVTSDIEVAGVTFKTEGLGIQYSPGSDFIITGSAEFDLKDDNSTTMPNQMVGVTFGGTDNSGTMHAGLDIAPNGTLKSLDAAINADITVGGAEFTATGLGVEYDSSTNDIAIFGGASVTFSGNTAQLQLGTSAAPGLVLDSMTGQLQSLDASVTANVNIDGIMLNANGLTVSYLAPQNGMGEMIAIDGDVSVMTSFLNFDANLGSASNPGIAIVNGQLENLNITVTGGLSLDGISLAANGLMIEYNQGMNMLELAGGVTVQFTSAFQFSANLAKGGLLINPTTGALTIDSSNGLEIKASVTIGPFSIQNLDIAFSNGPNGINFSATGMVMLPDNWGVDLTALTIVNGQLADIGLDITAQIPIGDTGLFLTQFGGELKNLNDPSALEIDANATIDVGETINIPSIEPFFGGDPNAAVASASGSLMINASELKLTGSVSILDGLLGQGTATLDLNWGAGVYSISGSFSMYDNLISFSGSLTFDNSGDLDLVAMASVNVPSFIPFIGGTSLAYVNFALHFVDPATHPGSDWADSYVAVWTNVNLFFDSFTIGFKADFTGNFSIINGNDVAAITAPPPPTTPQPMTYVYSYPFTIPQQNTPGAVADGTELTITAPALGSQGYPTTPGYDTVTSDGNGITLSDGSQLYSYQLSHTDVLLDSLTFGITIDEDTVPGGIFDGTGSFDANGDFVFTPATPTSLVPTDVNLFANGVLGMGWRGNVGETQIVATYTAADAYFELYQNTANGMIPVKTYSIDPVTNDPQASGLTNALPMDALTTETVQGVTQPRFGNQGPNAPTNVLYSLTNGPVDPASVKLTLYQGSTELGTGYFTSASNFVFSPKGSPALVPTSGALVGTDQIAFTWSQNPGTTSINVTYAASDNRLIEVSLAQDTESGGIPGSYVLELVATSTSNPQLNPSFTQWDQYDPPTAQFDGTPTVDANGVLNGTVVVGVYTPDTSSATVSLYYNTDDNLGAGTLIETVPYNQLTGSPALLSFNWHGFADLPAGDYYVYAEVNDGMNQPTYSAIAGPFSTSGAKPTLGGATSLSVMPGTGGVLQGVFSSATDNALTIGPNFAGPVTVNLTVNGGGSITLPNLTAWTQTADPTTGFTTLSQTFANDAAANLALDGLQFTAGAGFGGGTTLTLSASVTVPMTANGMTEQDTLTSTAAIPIVTTNTHLVVAQAVSGTVTGVTVTGGGSGYQTAPTVSFVSADGLGSGAQGFARIANGQVVGITVTNPGLGYDVAPAVILTGGGAATTATATAVILAPPSAPDQALIAITVTNPGGPDGHDGTNVQVQNDLTAGLTVLSFTASAGSFDLATGLWTIGALPLTGANSATLTLTVQADAGSDDTALSSSAIATSALPNFPRADAQSVAFVLPLSHAVVITPQTLPQPVVGAPYRVQLSANGGGGGPYTFSVTDGTLPTGLTLSPTGLISGTPTGSFGIVSFAIAATNAYGASTTVPYQVNLDNGALGVVGQPYLQVLGPTSDDIAQIGSNPLPPGLTVSQLGSNTVLTGLPTTPGTYPVLFYDYTTGDWLDYHLFVDAAVVPAAPTLPSALAGSPTSATFAGTGGDGQLFVALVSGTLPAGLMLNGDTLSGTVAVGTTPGCYNFSLSYTDSSGADAVGQYAIVVEPALATAPATLAATPGNPYSLALDATGGSSNGYVFTAVSLPIGLTLSSAGMLNGTLPLATPPGLTPISFLVTDANGATAMQTLNLAVNPPVTVTPSDLPDGLANAPYQATLTAAGGVGTGYTFAVTSGMVPAGLTLSSDGVLSGTIASTAAGGYDSFTVTATDAQGDHGSVTCTLFVDARLTVGPASLPNPQPGVAYSQQLTVSGGSGIFTGFAITAGSLPAGLSLSAAGLLAGTIANTAPAGSYPFTVSAIDSAGMAQSLSYTFTVAATTATWTGAVSSAWNNPANWSPHVVPGAQNNVTIPSQPTAKRFPVLSSGVVVNNLTLQAGASLSLDGNGLTVAGRLVNQGAVILEGTESVHLADGNDTTEGAWEYVGDGTGHTITLQAFGPTSYFNLDIADTHTHRDTFVTAGNLTIAGNLDISGGVFAPTGSFTFAGTGTEMLLSDGQHFANLVHSGTGTLSLAGTGLFVAGTLTNTAGSVQTNNLPVTVGGLTTLAGGTFHASTASEQFKGGLLIDGGTLVGSTGTISAAGVQLSAGTLEAPSTLTDTGNWSVGAGTFNCGQGTVILAGLNQQISGNTTFFNLTKTTTVADTLAFAAGSTQAIGGALTLKGTAGKLLALRSSMPGAPWNLVPMGKTAASFVAVADSRNMGLTAIVATHSENGGDDSGWTFM